MIKIEFNENEVLLILSAVLSLIEECGLGEMEYIEPLRDMEEKLNSQLPKEYEPPF